MIMWSWVHADVDYKNISHTRGASIHVNCIVSADAL